MSAEPTNYEGLLNKIKSKLIQEFPVILSFCAREIYDAEEYKADFYEKKYSYCSGEGHAVVVHGYKQICDSKNVCRDTLRIQNSWGQSWQDHNSNGWVDAQTLLDRTSYVRPQIAVWIEVKAN